MDRYEDFVANQNIDRYLDLMCGDMDGTRHRTMIDLLVLEEDRLASNIDQLQRSEKRMAEGQARIGKFRRLALELHEDPVELQRLESILERLEQTQSLICAHVKRLRQRLSQT